VKERRENEDEDAKIESLYYLFYYDSPSSPCFASEVVRIRACQVGRKKIVQCTRARARAPAPSLQVGKRSHHQPINDGAQIFK